MLKCTVPWYLRKSVFVTSILIRQQIVRKRTSTIQQLCFVPQRNNKCTKAMATEFFKGHSDRFNGVTINSNEESCENDVFTRRLEASMQYWLNEKKRAVWFRVFLPHTEWIPILVKKGFKFHHAQKDYAMLFYWLSQEEECNIPPYAHTHLGVGGCVLNEKTNEILVVKEKYGGKMSLWKLPGGYVDPGENIEDAVKREVREETGIQTEFKCLITFRHGHEYAFGCSDIYMVAYLTPTTFDIQKSDREISHCQWMKLTDYAKHQEVHQNNRILAMKLLEFLEHRMGITVNRGQHPITKKPISVYSLSKVDPN